VVTICTTSLTFNNCTFCPHSVFMCFVWTSEQTAIISLYSINWLVCITETECVYCAVRTGYTKSSTGLRMNLTFILERIISANCWQYVLPFSPINTLTASTVMFLRSTRRHSPQRSVPRTAANPNITGSQTLACYIDRWTCCCSRLLKGVRTDRQTDRQTDRLAETSFWSSRTSILRKTS
jgi:hypothetical protein